MRVSFPCNRISTGPLGGCSAREASHREIETPPEKMDRADLSQEPRSKNLEYLVDPDQYPPKLMHDFRIICRVRVVFFKRNRIGQLARSRPYFYGDPEFRQGGHEVLVEIGDAL